MWARQSRVSSQAFHRNLQQAAGVLLVVNMEQHPWPWRKRQSMNFCCNTRAYIQSGDNTHGYGKWKHHNQHLVFLVLIHSTVSISRKPNRLMGLPCSLWGSVCVFSNFQSHNSPTLALVSTWNTGHDLNMSRFYFRLLVADTHCWQLLEEL